MKCPYCDVEMTNARRVQCGAPDCARRHNAERSRGHVAAWREREKAAGRTGQSSPVSRVCVVCDGAFQTRKRDAKYCTSGSAKYKQALRAGPCSYCGVTPANGIDHIEPKSETGADDWTNYTACCQRCNGAKGTLPLLTALVWLPASRQYHDLRRVLWAA